MRKSVTPNPACMRCFASLTVAYQSHGIDIDLLEKSLAKTVEREEQHLLESHLGMSTEEMMQSRAESVNLQILLNLLRAKALS
jgi:hypothetical protein